MPAVGGKVARRKGLRARRSSVSCAAFWAMSWAGRSLGGGNLCKDHPSDGVRFSVFLCVMCTDTVQYSIVRYSTTIHSVRTKKSRQPGNLRERKAQPWCVSCVIS